MRSTSGFEFFPGPDWGIPAAALTLKSGLSLNSYHSSRRREASGRILPRVIGYLLGSSGDSTRSRAFPMWQAPSLAVLGS